MRTNKSKQQKSKKLHVTLDLVAQKKEERPTQRLHPLFSGMFKTMFPHSYAGGKKS